MMISNNTDKCAYTVYAYTVTDEDERLILLMLKLFLAYRTE